MASIISRTINGEVDQRLSINGEEIGRTISIGSDWTKLRIGMRITMLGSTAIGTSMPLAIGLSSGTAKMYADPSTTHFVGFRTGATAWTISGSHHIPGNWEKLVKVGGIVSSSAITWTNTPVIPRPETKRGQFFLDITKGSGATPTSWILNIDSYAANNSSDVNLPGFIASMQTLNDVNATAFTGDTSITVDEEANGTLDTINIAWLGTAGNIELSDIGYTRLA